MLYWRYSKNQCETKSEENMLENFIKKRGGYAPRSY